MITIVLGAVSGHAAGQPGWIDPRLAAFARVWSDVPAVRTTWGWQFERPSAADPQERYRCSLIDTTLGRPYELLKSDRVFTRGEPFPPEDLPWAIENWVQANPKDAVLRHPTSLYQSPDGLLLDDVLTRGVAGGDLHRVEPKDDRFLGAVHAGPHALAWWVLEHPAEAARAKIEDLPGGALRVTPRATDRVFVLAPLEDAFVLVRAEHAPAMPDMDGAVFVERFEDYAELPGLPPFPRRRMSDAPNLRQMPDGRLVYEHDNRNISIKGLIRAERLDRFPPEIPEKVRARAASQGVARGVSMAHRDDSRVSRFENGRLVHPPPLGAEPAPAPLSGITMGLRWAGVAMLALGMGWVVWRWKAGR
ncbi:MAG: hypothetical protein SFY69_05525 [Planctomycetota bacterium]|nr:hypothetical protein [Planctomycetota bacterium]